MKTLETKKFPIGFFEKPDTISQDDIKNWIFTIEYFPEQLRKTVENLTEIQLDTPYRENGWTIRQVVHHCADSHINSYCRFKLALTEENPTIKPYFENLWADFSDAKIADITPSLFILKGIHQRWSQLLKEMNAEDFEKTFYHPENRISIALKENLGIYDWHCRHHLAHITELKKEKNWE